MDFDRGYDGRVMTITISNIQKRHEGIYKCTLTTQYDTADATIDVKVEAYGPVIIEHSNNQTVFNKCARATFSRTLVGAEKQQI